jgi:hypothetical protein
LPAAIAAEKQESAAPAEKSIIDPAIPRFEPPPDDLREDCPAEEQEQNSKYPFDHIVTPEKEAQKKKSKKSVSI